MEIAAEQRKTSVKKKTINWALSHLLLIIPGIMFLFPFVWMVSTALKPDYQIFRWPPEIIPDEFLWSNFSNALTMVPFGKYTFNTFIICFWSVVGTVISSSLVAYGFSKIRWRGRNLLFVIMISTMMLPYQAVMVPVFIIFKELDWVGSFKPLIIPAFFGNAFFIFLLRQFFLTIPHELSDAAKIDGCSEFRIYWQIIIPLAKPALATTALFTFLAGWSDFLGPLIYLNDESKYTISLGLQQFIGQFDTRWNWLMAASTVTTLPIIILFFLTQRTFIQGIVTTGLKG